MKNLISDQQPATRCCRVDRIVRDLGVFSLALFFLAPGATAQELPKADAETDAAPVRVVLLPVEFEMYEFSAGGVIEPVPDWTSAAERNLRSAMLGLVDANPNLEMAVMPQMTDETTSLVEEHVALYNVAASASIQVLTLGGKPWSHKLDEFDYTVGDGLGFLADESGADIGIVVAGSQVKSSGGRVAMMIFMAAAGYSMQTGAATMSVGQVDLRTGQITWLNYAPSSAFSGHDLRKPDEAADLLRELVGAYPGGRIFGRK